MAYHSSRDNPYRSRGRRVADLEEEIEEWAARERDRHVSRDRNANSTGNREGINALRPSYRHLDADVNLRARLQRAPEDYAALRPTLEPYGGILPEDGRRGREYDFLPEPRSRLALAPDVKVYSKVERHRRASDLLDPGYGGYPETADIAESSLKDGFDLKLTFQCEDTWTSSSIDSESSPAIESSNLGKENTERKSTLFNTLISWAWGLGPHSLSGGELHGFLGPSRKKQACHFRWLHTQQNNMDFDHFFLNAIHTAGLKGSESNAILKSQETIRARFVKPVTAGQIIKGRQMTPNVFFGNSTQGRSVPTHRYNSPGASVLFCSIPFFLLREYAENNLPTRSGLFPTRALLQSQNSAVKKARELSQVLRKLYDSDRDVCLHVSQVWCLALGDDYLFTCSTLALEELMGENCKIHIQPRPGHILPPSVQGRQYVTVRSANETIVLPLDQCGTWLEFTSHFGAQAVNFEESYFLKWQALEVTWDTWAKVYQSILNSDSPLHLETRIPERGMNPRSMGAARGIYDEFNLTGVEPPSRRPPTRAREPGRITEAYSANLFVENPDLKQEHPTPNLGNFHAFTWICAVPDYPINAKSGGSSEKHLADVFGAYTLDVSRYRKAMSEVGEFLESRLSPKEAQIYGSTVGKSINDIADVHKILVSESLSSKGRSIKAEFAWAAKVVLAFFFPALTEDKVVRRYWGGAHAVLSLPDDNRPRAPQFMDETEVFTTQREPFRREDRGRTSRLPPSNDDGEESRSRSPSTYLRGQYGYESESRPQRRRSRRGYTDEDEPISDSGPPPPRRRGPSPLSDAVKRVKKFRAEDVSAFIRLARRLQKMTSIFEAHRKENGRYFKIPSAFSNAWLHCLLFMVQHASPVHASHKSAKKSLEQCILLIDQGLAEIMASLAPGSLHEKTALQPRGVMALVINRLIEDVVGDSPDVLSIYSSYIDELKAKIEDDPLKRIHQRTISYFNEEIETIIRTLEGQGQVIADLTDITSTSERSFLSPAASMERGRAEFGRAFELLWEQKSFILQRIGDFTGLGKEALVLESFSKNEIETTKDRHDSAIYAFTIVTIIFLPLSFVCSFLGMNTTDIRDQSTSQWVFWASAIPLTFVVIVLSLWWSGEWRNIRDSIGNALRPRKYKLA